MGTLLHLFFIAYLDKLDQVGIPGVLVMTALLFPGELVIPPAAYTEVYKVSHGNLVEAIPLALLVILAGTLGFYISVAILYWAARGVGRPLILKCGKYCLVSPQKLALAERWIAKFGAPSVFFSVLLPGIRHVIALPAGIAGMRFMTFSFMALSGGFLWATMLTIFGLVMAKDMAVIVQGTGVEPASLQHAAHNLTLGSSLLVLVIVVLYFAIVYRQSHAQPADKVAAGVAK